MGQILSQPETEKHSEVDSDKYLAYGLSCMQGWRINMEDAHATILNLHKDNENEEHVAFFGVYDGHGGEKSAIFTGLRLHDLIRATDAFKKKDYPNALRDGFLLCDQAILQDVETRNDDSGCAATSAIITPSQIICGNAGDSRTVMSVNGFAKALSYDHKPFNEGEKARITAGGGYVDAGRVNGNLALSRGIGDFMFKKNTELPAEEQIVTCYPDVISHDIDFEKDEFVILACDGIWDCLSSQSCVECVRRGIYERKPFAQICEEIMELCCAPTSDGSGIGCDNMSILIVALLDHENNETLDQWYDKIIEKVDLHTEQMEAIRGKEDDVNAYLEVEYGPISPVYNDLYRDIFGEYYTIGQQGNGGEHAKSGGGYSMFGNMGSRNGPSNEEDTDEDLTTRGKSSEENELDTGAISLQKLLSSNMITNENGVIYLDTSSAQSLLASFGMGASGLEEGDEQDRESDDSVHQKHIEEVDEEDDSEAAS
ncbi:PP2C-domain-containing protein [Metschnikowia bicuspidata var. bicuspidata NRRL YB-4993]|uniref:protein-serine/threonine phosphatase n=1 Tax=Metschnikowia bicuspidata var. bicuspidata NRRL YB-4993 TaxID=869754 RepID=A0A1A0HEG4_9ASCO|nr:PP2C-domain-containing protein [Metschnikowia bicuspidata var. bicuspidata NRRL YB-4993]OBA22292.1 PP2C-domain-containing protein [Metschnikowia bicuspidata var. bicuspidata NRRL YB-4993]